MTNTTRFAVEIGTTGNMAGCLIPQTFTTYEAAEAEAEHRRRGAGRWASVVELGADAPALPPHAAGLLPRLVALLANIGEVIDTTDPESDLYLDSGADTVQALCEHETETRALLAALEATQTAKPEPVRIVLNISGGVLQGASIDRGAIDLLAVDYDADESRDVPQAGGGTTQAETTALGAYLVQPAWVAEMFADHEAANADDGCPKGDPDCEGNNGDCHDACTTFADREAVAFPHDGQRVIPGQLPHETATDAENRRAADLMGRR